MKKPKAHFLHIGKTGGTALKRALQPHVRSGAYELMLHEHRTRLSDVPQGERVFFLLRHPITRFVSGFNSRLRQGRPRYDFPWNDRERAVFTEFKTANALAEALSDADSQRRDRAQRAMQEIRHVRESVWDWFRDEAYFESRRSDLLFVGFQETLTADFARLLTILGLNAAISLPSDPVEMHQTPSSFDRTISELGAANLARHYARDTAFYEDLKSRAAAEQSV